MQKQSKRFLGQLVLSLVLFALAGYSAAQATSDELLAAAREEGQVIWYTSVDVQVAEKLARAFEQEYPGIDVQVERSGSGRIFQRVDQEYRSGIHNVDVINTSDASHFEYWKDEGMLAQHVPPDVESFDDAFKDADGMYATWRSHLSVIGYNTSLVPADQAPSSHRDLLDPKWKGRLVKAHPSYSGTIVTHTYALAEEIGWEFFEELAQQDVMQVQSSTAPPKTIAAGERMAMADGNEYNMFIEMANGSPLAIVYAEEGTPFVDSPGAVMADAPHPNAARVFQNYLFSVDAQQVLVDDGGLRSAHPGVTEPEGRTPLSEIKLLFADPRALIEEGEALKERYSSLFGN